MPPIIAGIAALGAAFGASAATAFVVGSTIIELGLLGVSMLVSYLTRPQAQTVTMQAVARQPVSYRRCVYGQTRVSGVMTYIGVSGGNNDYLHMVITLAGHQVESIGTIYIEGFAAHSGSGLQGSSYPYYQYEVDLGDPANSSQPFPLLHSAIPSWDSTCLQRGNAKVHIALKYDVNVFPNGAPSSIAFDVKGKLLYDPRSSTTAYSNNPALVVRDWLIDTQYGMAADATQIDDSYTIAAANICDQSVATSSANVATIGSCTAVNVSSGLCTVTATNNLRVGTEVTFSGFTYATFLNGVTSYVTAATSTLFYFAISSGDYATHSDSGTASAPATQPRYTCDGVVDAGQPRGDVLRAMLTSMAGYCIPPGDAWRIIAGAYVTPTIILTEDDVRGPIKMDTLVSMRDLANGITGTFTSPANLWQSSNFPPYQDSTALAEDGNQPLWQSIQLPFTTDGIRAQRLAKIYLQRIRRQKSLILPCKLSAFPLQPGDTVMFSFDLFGFNQKVFEVQQTSVVLDSSTTPIRFGVAQPGQGSDMTSGNQAYSATPPCLGVDLQLHEIDANVFAWNPATDENTWLGPQLTTTPDPTSCLPPTSVTASSGSGTAIVRADGLITDRILVQWTSPADVLVTSGGKIQIFTSPHGAGTYSLAGSVAGSDTQFYILNVVDGSAYDILVYSVNSAGVSSDGVAVDNTTASGGTTNFGGTVSSIPASDIAALTTIGAYSGATAYTVGMEVTYSGNTYKCILSTTGHVPTNTSYWVLMGPDTLDNLTDGSTNFSATSSTLSYRPTSNPLTAHDNSTGSPPASNSTINIASFTMRTSSKGDISISGGSITALSYSTLYEIYYDDANLAGGAVTFHATTTKETAINGTGRFFVGSIVTPPALGSDTPGNNDGGVGAQGGGTSVFLFGTESHAIGLPATLTNPTYSYDGDTSTAAVLAIASGGAATATVSQTVKGAAPSSAPWSSLKLYIRSSLTNYTVRAGSHIFGELSYSLDGGTSFTDIYLLQDQNRALATDVVTLPLNQNLALVQVKLYVFSISNPNAGLSGNLYEAWVVGVI